jgi:hypothetical protein
MKKLLISVAAMLFLGPAGGFDTASAAEPVVHAGRNVTYLKSVEIIEKDEAAKLVKGKFVREGLTFHTEGPRAGEVSTFVITGAFEFTKGAGPYTATILRTFDDGATVTVAVTGGVSLASGKPLSTGDYRCVDGTENMKGVTCEGSYTSRPLKNKMTIVDWKGMTRKPGS